MPFCFFFLFCLHCLADPYLTKEDLVLRQTFEPNIEKAIQFLLNRQKDSGKFLYDYLPFQGKSIHTGVMIRQAGALLSLAFAWDGKNPKVKTALEKCIEYFKTNSSVFEAGGKTMRIISEDHESYTGTICLFLSSVFYLHYKFPQDFLIKGEFYQELMRTLDYYYNFKEGLPELINIRETYLEKRNRDSEVFATAQYFLTLSLYHLVYRLQHYNPILLQLMSIYNRKMSPYQITNSYLWVMLGARFQAELNNQDHLPDLLKLAAKFQNEYQKLNPIKAGMQNNCPAVEGLVYYNEIRQMTGVMTRQHLYEITYQLRHLTNFQIRSGIERKVVDGSTVSYQKIVDPLLAEGGFFHKEDDNYHTRIDMTQHCLMAYLGQKRIFDAIFEDRFSMESSKRNDAFIQYREKEIQKSLEPKDKTNRVIIKDIIHPPTHSLSYP